MLASKNDSASALVERPLASLADVLGDNDEADLLDKIMEQVDQADERPPLIIHWQRAQEFVAAILKGAEQAQGLDMDRDGIPKPPFRMPQPLTTAAFKKALMEYAQTGQAEPLGTSCLPGTTTELCRSEAKLADLRDDVWVRRVITVGGANCVLPLANIYTPNTLLGLLEPAIYARPNPDLWNA
jgi:hypothetical protein